MQRIPLSVLFQLRHGLIVEPPQGYLKLFDMMENNIHIICQNTELILYPSFCLFAIFITIVTVNQNAIKRIKRMYVCI